MKIGIKRLVALAGIVFLLSAFRLEAVYPDLRSTVVHAQGDGRAVLQKVCGTCHSLDRVTGSRRSRAQWEEVTAKMISMGAKGSDEEVAAVINFLAANYGRESTPAPAQAASPRPPARPAGGGAGPDDKHVVDDLAADRGRAVWATQCIACHGTTARGTANGANLVRSDMMWSDRYGSTLLPYLQKGHPTQSGTPSQRLGREQIADLAHFIHQRLYDTLRGSPIFDVQNVLTGDAKKGEAWFNGEGKCATCHSVTGDLAGIGKRYNPAMLQQRFLFPRVIARGGNMKPPKPVTVTVTPTGGASVSGLLLHLDDFTVALRDDKGEYHSWKRSALLKVVRIDPLQAHIDLLDRITDKNMHDIVAYLEKLK